MKTDIFNILKHKLQWLLLLAALLGVSQTVWSDGRDFVDGEYFYFENGYDSGVKTNWILQKGYIYLCNGSSSAEWIELECFSGTAGEAGAMYRAKITGAKNHKTIIFTRGASNYSGGWGGSTGFWNQTGDLTLTDKNFIQATDFNTQLYYAVEPSSCTISLGGSHSGSGTSGDPYIVSPGESLTFTITATQADPGMTGVGANVNTAESKASSAAGTSVTVSKTASSTAGTSEIWTGYAWAYKNSTSTYSSSYATSSSIYTRVAAGCDQPEMAQPTKKNDRVNGMVMYVKATSLGDCAISKWGLKAWTSSACSGDAAFTTAIDNDDTALTTSNQEVTISGLTSNTTYYFKSYVELDDETIILSDSYTQRTTRIEVSANDATGISSTAAIISGSTTSGGSAVTTLNSAAGFIYSTNKSDIDTPNVSEGHATFVSYGSVTSVGSNFSYTFSGLSPNNTYYYKAMIVYTTNGSELTAYSGTTKSFTTNNVFGTVSIDNNGVSSVCLGSGTVTWNASASSGSPTSWTVNSSNTAKATATITDAGVITITPVAAGTSTITATAKKAGYDDKTSDGVTITVNALPTISLTGTGAVDATHTYPWEWMTVTATTSPSNLTVSWSTSFSGPSGSLENSMEEIGTPNHTYKVKSNRSLSGDQHTMNIDVTGTVTDANGCSNSAMHRFYNNQVPAETCN